MWVMSYISFGGWPPNYLYAIFQNLSKPASKRFQKWIPASAKTLEAGVQHTEDQVAEVVENPPCHVQHGPTQWVGGWRPNKNSPTRSYAQRSCNKCLSYWHSFFLDSWYNSWKAGFRHRVFETVIVGGDVPAVSGRGLGRVPIFGSYGGHEGVDNTKTIWLHKEGRLDPNQDRLGNLLKGKLGSFQ